jgi:release factor glutamine methyltransferase
MSEPRSVEQLLEVGTRVLEDSTHIFDDHDNAAEAEELLSMCMDVEDLEEVPDDHIPPKRTRERYLALVARRAAGEPFPFLTGHITIYGLELPVRAGAFIPRPSSELVIDIAVKKARKRKDPVVVDVCTGQGPIALVIAHEVPTATVYGADIDGGGIAQGRANAMALGIGNATFFAGDMFAPLPPSLAGKVDIVTAHVPYVSLDELEDLPSEVREHEPVYTLSDESRDGMFLMRRAVLESVPWIKPGGWLLLEMAEDLTKKVEKMCRKAGFTKTSSSTDRDALSWVVEARLPKG